MPNAMIVEGFAHPYDHCSPVEQLYTCISRSSCIDGCSAADQPRSCATSRSRDLANFATARVPPAAAFNNGDVLVRSPCESEQVVTPLTSQQHQTVPFNNITQAVDFETPLFKGQALVMLKGLPDSGNIFDGKKRLMWMTVQGQFKQPVGLDSLMLGSEFERPLKLPAGSLLSRASMWLVQRMGSGVQLDTTGSNPHILAPLIAAAQIVNVSRPGQQPSMLAAEEDLTLFDPSLVSSWTGKPMTAAKRRSHFSSKSHRQRRMFDTENVWTFHVYDHVMDYSTFLLPIPFFNIDLVQVLDGQPMQLLLKDVDNSSPMLKLEVWHKRMLEHKSNANSPNNASSQEVAQSSPAPADTRMCFECGVTRQAAGSLSRSASLQAAAAAAVVGLIKA